MPLQLNVLRRYAGLAEVEDSNHEKKEKDVFASAKQALEAVCSLAEVQMKEIPSEDSRMNDYQKMYKDAMNLRKVLDDHLTKYQK